MKMSWSKLVAGLGTLLMACSPLVVSQEKTPGVDDHQILIGSCAALDGPAGYLGLQTVTGASAYLDYINAEGGVHGRKVQLLAFDDGILRAGIRQEQQK